MFVIKELEVLDTQSFFISLISLYNAKGGYHCIIEGFGVNIAMLDIYSSIVGPSGKQAKLVRESYLSYRSLMIG